jgi:hypothetical protein
MQATADQWRNAKKQGTSAANPYFFVKRPQLRRNTAFINVMIPRAG